MKLQLATLLGLVAIAAYGQKPPLKFGDVSLDEVKMTKYDADTSASAVYLYDFGNSEVKYIDSEGWFKLEFERVTRIKILKKDGYSFADFEIPVYHISSDKEKLTNLKVSTYNLENGKMVETKMKSDGSFVEKSDQNTDIVKFTAPNVKEGSVIEVTYKITSDFLSYFRDWEFQSTIPVVWSEYRTYVPEYFNYDRYMQGYVVLEINESKDNPRSFQINSKERTTRGNITTSSFQTNSIDYTEKSNRWIAKNVPAFREEPFMTSRHDYISKINFELVSYRMPNQPVKQMMGTWADLNKSMLESEYFGDAVKGSGFLKKITEEVTTGLTTPQEKISAIYNYVKSSLEWDGTNRKFLNTTIKDALEKKKGSSAHINLMLTSMLQKAGLNASPVILSTRSHGFVREAFALSSQFNYVITHVALDDKYILLDATDRLLPMHILPERCLNGRGYIISNENHGWVNLTSPKSKKAVEASMELTASGDLKGQLKITTDGLAARRVRNVYLGKGEEDYIKEFQHGKSFEVEKSEFVHVKDLGKPVEEIHNITWEEHPGSAQTLFISPLINFGESTNPFKLEKRQYPVDFGSPFEQVIVYKLTIPENYVLDELPPNKVVALPNGSGRFLYNSAITGNMVSVTSIFSIARSLFAQTEYEALREFYNIVVAKQAEQIVLKKKQ